MLPGIERQKTVDTVHQPIKQPTVESLGHGVSGSHGFHHRVVPRYCLPSGNYTVGRQTFQQVTGLYAQ